MLESLSSKLSKYLAPQIYQSIFSGRQDVSLETKRKKLTVFFSDIKDFTQITEDLQAEDLASLLNEYFTEMSKIALEHGATIDKFIGDAMLMFFGDPESKGVEEDAKACVRMAIAMQRRMKDLQEDWRERGYEHPFRMRIGINTGFCNVGNFGSKDRMDYTIIGGEVNLAARLENQADPDGILLSYETYAVVRDMVDAEERPSIEAKGIRREIRPFALKNFFDRSEEDRYIGCDRGGLSIRIDLNKLSDEDRQETLEQLADVIKRLQR
jgi:class 3 adenylate cyclase